MPRRPADPSRFSARRVGWGRASRAQRVIAMKTTSSSGPRVVKLVVLAGVLAGALVGALYLRKKWTADPASVGPVTRPTTRPTQPIVEADEPPQEKPPRDFMDVVLKNYPEFPTTRPLGRAIDLSYAAHLLIPEPLFVDMAGNVWIARPDGEPAERLLKKAAKQSSNVSREHVLYVHWTRTDQGQFIPLLVVPNPRGDGYEVVSPADRRPIGTAGREYDWPRAFTLDDGQLGVPTAHGISLFAFTPKTGEPVESHAPLDDGKRPHAPVEVAFFKRMPIAWVPPTKDHPGSGGAVRAVEKDWFRLSPEAGWKQGILQLIPMEDSILLLVRDPASAPDVGTLAVVGMEKSDADEREVFRLIDQLSDPDPDRREKAYEQLTRYRGSLWGPAQKAMPAVPPEAQARLKELLKGQVTPLMGNAEPADGKLQLVARFSNGGSLYYSEKGVWVPRAEGPIIVPKAWLSALPGEPVRLLGNDLVYDLDPRRSLLFPTGDGRWIVADDAQGPRMYLGGGVFQPLLRKDEASFNQFIGLDRFGRFYFRKLSQATSRPAATPTLIIDPNLPDARPRLPAWVSEHPSVGWDREDYPAVQLEANYLTLRVGKWELVNLEKNKFFSRPEDVPPIPAPPTRRPTTVATTRASTRPATAPAIATADDGKPIHLDSNGNYYFNGRDALRVLKPDGSEIVWPLPPTATGELSPAHLVVLADRIFLFNQPGRLLRLKRTHKGPEPFVVEATFSRGIPNTEDLTRMWVDPHGRICMTWNGRMLAILFPEGYISGEMRNMLPTEVLDEMMRNDEADQ